MGKGHQLQVQRYPFLSGCAVFSGVQMMAWLPVFEIFNVRTYYVQARNCTGGLYGHCRVCVGNCQGEKYPAASDFLFFFFFFYNEK